MLWLPAPFCATPVVCAPPLTEKPALTLAVMEFDAPACVMPNVVPVPPVTVTAPLSVAVWSVPPAWPTPMVAMPPVTLSGPVIVVRVMAEPFV